MAVPPMLARPATAPRAATPPRREPSLWEKFTSFFGADVEPSASLNFVSPKQNAELQATQSGMMASALDAAYSYGVARPISTAAQVLNPWGENAGDFSQAWDDSEKVSPGQALASSPFLSPAQYFMQRQTGAAWAQPDFDVTDDEQRKAAFEDNWYGRFYSASGDALVQWFVDPTVIAGKAAAAYRVNNLVRPIEGAKGAERLAENVADLAAMNTDSGVVQLAEDLTKIETFSQARFHPWVANSSQPDLLAAAIADTRSFDETANVILAAQGHKPSLRWLEQERKSVHEAMVRAKQERDLIYDSVNGNFDYGANVFPYSPQVLDDAEKVLADYTTRYEHFARMMPEQITGQARGGIGASAMQSPVAKSANIERARTWEGEKRWIDQTGLWRTETFQPGPGQYAVRKLTWLGKEQPAGHMRVGGIESSQQGAREIFASFRSVPAYKGNVRRIHPDTGEEIFVSGAEDMDRWAGRFARAADDAERREIAMQMETQIVRDVVAHRFETRTLRETNDIADRILDRYRVERNYHMANQADKRGYLVNEAGELVVGEPQLMSQLANSIPLMDFRYFDKLARNDKATLLNLAYQPAKAVGTGLDLFYAIWRPAMLLRLGYTQRNVGEGELRALAYFGTTGANPFTGMGRIAGNMAARGRGAVARRTGFLGEEGELRTSLMVMERTRAGLLQSADEMAQSGAAWTAARGERLGGERAVQMAAARQQIAEIEAAIKALPKDAKASARKDLAKQLEAANRQLAKARNAPVDNPAVAALDEQIAATRQALADIGMSQKPYIRKAGQRSGEAFADEPGNALRPDVARYLASADRTMANTIDGAANRFGQTDLDGAVGRLTNDWIAVTPDKPQYFSELANVANKQFRNDPLIGVMLREGDDAAVRWLNTEQGRAYLRTMKDNIDVRVTPSRADRIEHVGIVREALERYLPDETLRADLAVRDLDPAEISAKLAGRPDLSAIHGRDLAESRLTAMSKNADGSLIRGYRAATGKVLHWIGSIPENIAVRHPFYNEAYKRSMASQLAVHGDDVVSHADQLTMSRAAHAQALTELKSTIYTIERYSNLGVMMKWLAPFYAAWANTARSWAKLVVRDPSVAARARIGWNGIDNAFTVVDSDGNPATAATPLGEQKIVLQIPQAFIDKLPDDGYFGTWKEALESNPQLTINKGSLNIVLQGDPWWLPGFGPTVSLPMNVWLNNDPGNTTAQAVGKYALPLGPSDNPLMEVLPAWAKRVATADQGDENQTYANAVTAIFQAEFYKWKTGQREKEPTPSEIESRAQALFKLRRDAALVSPATLGFNIAYKPIVDDWRRMLKEDASTAFERFIEKYGDDASVFTASQSRNETGVAADKRAYENTKKHGDLVEKVGGIDPRLIGLVVNPQGEFEFDRATYNWQSGRKAYPGAAVEFRGPNNPSEAIKESQEQLGWVNYAQLSDALDAILKQRGLTSYNQKAAADLAAMKREWVERQKDDNYAWWRAYKERDSGKWADNVRAFRLMLSNESWWEGHKDENTWQLVREYLVARDDFEAILKARGGTLQSKANEDVADAWSQLTDRWKSADPDFARIYDRYLESDTLEYVPYGDN